MAPGTADPCPSTASNPQGRAHAARVISAAAVALALTAPGQTAVVSVFVDPILGDLDVSRSAVSTAYLVGSLAGAFVMPYLGRLIDRFGPRRIMAAIAVCFGAVLVAGSAVSEIVGLTAAFIGVRAGGQGALGLVATTTVAVYVHRRRGFAIGVSSAVGTAGISLAPMLLDRLVATADWRHGVDLGGHRRLGARRTRRAPAAPPQAAACRASRRRVPGRAPRFAAARGPDAGPGRPYRHVLDRDRGRRGLRAGRHGAELPPGVPARRARSHGHRGRRDVPPADGGRAGHQLRSRLAGRPVLRPGADS